MKVLIVDDSSTIRNIIGNVLVELGVKKENISQAHDGISAWDTLKNKHFDLILTDWNMPNMDGLELVDTIRGKYTSNKDIPIIMITTEGSKDEVLTALDAGVNNFISKPFNAETLRIKLEGLIKI